MCKFCQSCIQIREPWHVIVHFHECCLQIDVYMHFPICTCKGEYVKMACELLLGRSTHKNEQWLEKVAVEVLILCGLTLKPGIMKIPV